MGNLEKAGVLVVVALLAVILVVAFLNFPDHKTGPVLNASSGKMIQLSDLKNAKPRTEPANVYPEGSSPPADLVVKDDPAPPSDVYRILPEPRTTPKSDVPTDAPDTAKNAKPVLPDPPAEKAPPVVATPGYPKTVKVQAGDTLWLIAVREYGPKVGPQMLASITDANPRVRPEALKAGTEVSLPAPSAELAAAKPRPDTDKKVTAAPPQKKTTTTPVSAPKPTRKLPFIPN